MVFKITIVGSIPASLVLFIVKICVYTLFDFFCNLLGFTNINILSFIFKKRSTGIFFKLTHCYTYDFFFIKFFFHIKNIFFNNFRVFFRGGVGLNINSILSGFFFFWKHVRFWVPTVFILFIIIYISLSIRVLPFLRISTEWFLVSMAGYWLISGFVFFTKKYKFGKFTSAIQRFWRRSFILFWVIESSLFVVFLYLAFNASQEVPYAFDISQLDKSRLYSWKHFIFKSYFVFLIIILSYITLISIKWNIFSKTALYLLSITAILTYVVWLEFYQFFYIINWYGEATWFFDIEDKLWYSESVYKRTRIINHYITICTIAKFWHIIFIYIYWVFFLLRALEAKHVNYVLFSTNLQNFIILYIMNWVLMYPWFKFVNRRFLTKTHSSLKEFRTQYMYSFFYDFFTFYYSIISYPLNTFKRFNTHKFIYIIEPQQHFADFYFCKDFVRYDIINLLNVI